MSTDRSPVFMLDPAGATDGQVPVYDAAAGRVIWATPGGGIQSIVPGPGIAVDSTDPANPVVSATGSGGGGGTGRDRRWLASASASAVDEFNDDTLNAAWVRVDGTGAPAGNVTWTEGADVLSMVQSAGDTSGAAGHALLRPVGTSVAVGDAFSAGIQLLVPSTANFPSFGLVLADGTTFGSGSQVIGAITNSTGSTDQYPATWAYSGFNTRTAFTTASLFPFARGIYVHLRLVRTSTGWRTDISADGVGWVTGAVQAQTITPTHVGLFSTTFGTSTKFAASVDYLRRFSGVS